jgi:hypothetical protein
MLADARIVQDSGFGLRRSQYFPVNARAVGDWFAHHELQVLYIRKSQ